MWGVEYSLGGTFGSTFHLLKISSVLPKLTMHKQPRSLLLTFKHVKCPQENWISLFSTSEGIQFHQTNIITEQVFFHKLSLDLLFITYTLRCPILHVQSIRWVKLNVQNRHHKWVMAYLENVRETERNINELCS